MIETKKYTEAMKDLEELDGPQTNPDYIQDIAYMKGLVLMH